MSEPQHDEAASEEKDAGSFFSIALWILPVLLPAIFFVCYFFGTGKVGVH